MTPKGKLNLLMLVTLLIAGWVVRGVEAQAQTTSHPEQYTAGQANGRYWVALFYPGIKIVYLQGFRDGVDAATSGLDKSGFTFRWYIPPKP